MKNILYNIALFVLCAFLTSCHDIEDYDNTVEGNFEQLWTAVDQHYCFFNEKNINWDSIHTVYAKRLESIQSTTGLFNLCSDMLDELRDGHVNLAASFNTSYYRDWWSLYPQNYNERNVLQNYLNFTYRTLGYVNYGYLMDDIGYMHISSFASGIGDGNMSSILNYFRICRGLIIDVRDNGGGNLDNVETYITHFLKQRTLAGYILHKTGTGHSDFSEPYAYYYDPAPEGSQMWLVRPIIVLTNRSTYSAANNFVSIMKQLPNVKIVGATTGGGSGMPLTLELKCGWTLRMSAAPILDANGNSTEFGIEPTQGCAVDISAEDEAAGRDSIIDFAINLIYNS
jgi:C-terminal processing protease CtpA/Prc